MCRWSPRMVILSGLLLTNVLASQADNQTENPLYANEKNLPNDVCGETPQMLTTTIVGGKPADLGEFPWMALLGYRKRGSDSFDGWHCGGSLITDQYVLTAAHCINEETLTFRLFSAVIVYEPYKVRLGELDYDETVEDGAQPEDFEIEQLYDHAGYNRTHMINDIGLIKLKKKVTFTAQIRPICLPPAELRALKLTPEDLPTVAGWGKLNFNMSLSSKLMKVQLRVAELDSCASNLTRENPNDPIILDDRLICARAPGKASCKGDSGGPLMYYFQSSDEGSVGRWCLIGVVSYGPGECAVEDQPGVFTRVAKFMPWVLNKLYS